EQNGLCDREIWGMTEDGDGNLWAATRCGLMKIARTGFTTYGLADGLAQLNINSIFEDDEGQLIVINSGTVSGSITRGRIINRFDGKRFTAVEPNISPAGKYHGWGWDQTIIQDQTGG